MTNLQLTILGSGSAVPLPRRSPTSQFLTLSGRHFLLDCGEGTQTKLRQHKIGFGRINHIFISHLHGDHFFGLVPLLTTLHLLDRQKEMHLYGPPELEQAVQSLLDSTGSRLRFPLIYHVAQPTAPTVLYEDEALWVKAIPLEHGMPCWGYHFQEKPRPRKMRKEAIDRLGIPVVEIRQIKQGAAFTDVAGTTHANETLTDDPAPALSYAYCTDTAPLGPYLKENIGPVDLLYHEATFTETHRERAQQTTHCTARQAAEVAQTIGAQKLLLGHFSIRYDDLTPLEAEARAVYPQSFLAREDQVFELGRKDGKLHF